MMAIPLPKAPKVVFVNRYFSPDQSATSQLLTDLAHALADAALEVHVICSRQCYSDARARLASTESIGGVAVHRVWSSSFGRNRLLGRAFDYATFFVSSSIAMLRLLDRGDTLVAKTDPPLISIPAMMAAKLRGAQLINWLQDIFPEVASALGLNPLPRPFNALLRRWRNMSLRSAQLNIVLGARMRAYLQTLGIVPEKIRVIENWAELDPQAPKPADASALRARLGLAGKFVVGYSGNLGRAHEFLTLLDAADKLRYDPQIVFLMIGGGAGMEQLARLAAARRLQNFCFLPYQPRAVLADALAAADVHWMSLMPALEGLIVPSKFYGVLAAGRPVLFIGDPQGEVAREIRARGCGATVAINESEQLASLLRVWKSDPAQREAMGQCGHELYNERFRARIAFDQWKSILIPSIPVVGAALPIPSRR